MAGLCWMAVTLAFFLSAENTLAVDQNRLAEFVNGTLDKYGPEGMFSLTVRIPEDQDQKTEDILKKVYESDPSNKVSEKLNNREVYIGSRVVAAKVLKGDTGADHAESQVVDHLNDLFKTNNKSDLLLFYVNASPCVDKCTNQGKTESILEKINALNKWNSHAFVFSKTFKSSNGPSNTEEELRGALTRLGSKIGLDNIFRCDNKAGRMQCISCSSNGQVTRACFSDDDSQPGPSRSQPQQGSRGTAQGVESRSGRYRRFVYEPWPCRGQWNTPCPWGTGSSGRYRRGASFKVKGGWTRKKGGGSSGAVNFKGKVNTKKFGGIKAGVNIRGGWTHKKGVGSSGGVKISGSLRHKGGHGGNVKVSAGWKHKKGVGHSVRFGASGKWSKGGKKSGRKGGKSGKGGKSSKKSGRKGGKSGKGGKSSKKSGRKGGKSGKGGKRSKKSGRRG